MTVQLTEWTVDNLRLALQAYACHGPNSIYFDSLLLYGVSNALREKTAMDNAERQNQTQSLVDELITHKLIKEVRSHEYQLTEKGERLMRIPFSLEDASETLLAYRQLGYVE